MNDQSKTKAQLIQELKDLHHRLASADGSDSPNDEPGLLSDPAGDTVLREKGQEQLDILMQFPAARRFPIILVVGFGLLVTGIMVYSLFIGNRIAVRYAPLVDAAMEIKLEAALGHLWFEEIISGDRHKDIAVVWEHLDQSVWYARAMLEGGENPEGVFISLRDPVLRGEIEDVLAKISDFRVIAAERLAAEPSGIGTDIDQRFDAVFEDFFKQADKVETVLQAAMARDLHGFRILQGSLIALSLVLSILVGIIFRRYERRRTLDLLALWQSEENFRALAENAVDGILITTLNGKYLFANQRAADISGYSIPELLKISLKDLTLPEGYAQIRQRIEKRLSGEQVPAQFESTLIQKSSKRIPIEITAAATNWQGEPAELVIVRDITERKRAEADLIASEERSRLLFESANDAIMVLRLTPEGQPGRFIEVNEVACERLGYSREELSQLTPGDIAIIEKATLKDTMETLHSERKVIFEAIHKKKDGGKIPVEISSHLFELDGEKAILSVARDITERKKVQEGREKLVRDLERRNAEMERFNYTISHDLKSPLITIKGFTSLLEKELAKEKKQDAVPDALGYINTAVEKMHLLLEDMLELSRVGHLMNPVEDFALGQVVDEVVELLYGPINERQVKIVIDPDLPTVSADRTRIFQVMQNCIENGVKYIGEQKSPQITIGSREEGGEQVIYVRDNGIGIDLAHHSRIFDLFQQLNPSHEGSGVGLTLVKRIIELHGGRIWVESEGVGKGTAFCFTLPRQEAS